ncbi:MAG: sugar nucleotide-binding protein [Planctomycetota bacterium]
MDKPGGLGIGRVLVTGGSGFVGRALREALGGGCVGTYCGRAFEGGVRYDAAVDAPGDLLDRVGGVSHAVIAHAIATPDACAADPETARRVNVDSCAGLARACRARGIGVLFCSTELVFGGGVLGGDRAGWSGYGEGDPPAPQTLYGRLKVEAERSILGADAGAVVVRLGRVVSDAPGRGGLLDELARGLARPGVMRVATDQRFCPIGVSDAARAIALLLDRGVEGVVHVAGPSAVTRFEMAQRLRAAMGQVQPEAALAEVEGVSIEAFATPEPRPKDVSLRIDRLVETTGFRPEVWRGLVDRFAARWRPAIRTTTACR